MKHVWTCRRTFIGLTGLILLFILDLMKDEQTGGYMVAVVVAIAGANSMQAALAGKVNNAISSNTSLAGALSSLSASGPSVGLPAAQQGYSNPGNAVQAGRSNNPGPAAPGTGPNVR